MRCAALSDKTNGDVGGCSGATFFFLFFFDKRTIRGAMHAQEPWRIHPYLSAVRSVAGAVMRREKTPDGCKIKTDTYTVKNELDRTSTTDTNDPKRSWDGAGTV